MFKFIFYSILLAGTSLVMYHKQASVAMPGTILLKAVEATGFSSINSVPGTAPANDVAVDKTAAFSKEAALEYYKSWNLSKAGLSKSAFEFGMRGFNYLINTNQVKKNILSIVDFSKPSTEKRLYVINLNTGQLLFRTWVAHGQNSGKQYANKFSNSIDSHQSSLGFFVTTDTYTGSHGYSLKLKGCEKGINDNAYERDIVIHGADYVSQEFISSRGTLGRSYGCPAVPAELSEKIIETIKNGTCLFLYHPTKKYCSKSRILNSQA